MSKYKLPQLLRTEHNKPRRIGVEIEMSGIELAMIVCQCQIAYGGQIEETSPYEFKIRDSELGDFTAELDYEYLKNVAREKFEDDEEKSRYSSFEHYFSETLAALTKNLVPCELVCPPIDFEQLPLLDRVIDRLCQHGAKGTRHSPLAAFGVHLNPELPNLERDTIIRYFKAFLCLQDWLIEREKVNLTRKISPYIDRFPSPYIKEVLQPDYSPDLRDFMADYFAYNPTRNRILDMLPLFAWLDEEFVRSGTGDAKLNKRPTLHYRLPNSEIDDTDWGLWSCWNNWLVVESLANDSERLSEVCQAFQAHADLLAPEQLMNPWKKKVTRWIKSR
jgi:hypothetical protein